MAEIIWKDRKRIVFGLPWSFTRYSLTKEILYIQSGLMSQTEEEVRLYRILDVTLHRSLIQRIFGLGTIHCCAADKTTPEFDIKWIKNSTEVKRMLSDLVEQERQNKKVSGKEFFGDLDEDSLHDDVL